MPTEQTESRKAIIIVASSIRTDLKDLAALDPQTAHGTNYRPQVTLTSTNNSVADDVDIMADFDFACREIRGYIAFDVPSSELLLAGTFGSSSTFPMTTSEWLLLKAQNVSIDLENMSTKLKLIQEVVPLSSLMGPFGKPIEFKVPHMLRRSETVRMTAAYRSTANVNLIAQNTTVGLILIGEHLRTREMAKSLR
jgi:hypothetical protein